MYRTSLFFISLALALVLAGPAQAVSEGSPAPAFEITTLDGQKVDLDSVSAQGPMLLFFWTTWCHYCKEEIHEIQDFKEEYSSQGLQVLGINPGWRDSESRARSFRRRQEVDLTLAFDQTMRLSNMYAVQGVPTLFLLDDTGKVLYRGHGITPELRRTLDRFLAGS